MRVLLDMDCVLADFVAGAAGLYGLTPAALRPSWPAGEYGMEHVLARHFGWDVPDPGTGKPTFGGGQFWGKIGNTPGFWATLPEFPWTRELIKLVTDATDDWYVVTSPSRCPRCIPEKREWVNRVFGTPPGGWFDRLIPTPHKELMAVKRGEVWNGSWAVEPVVLIDDYDANCERFNKAGGYAVTFPAWHNHLHGYESDPMLFVRAAFDSVRRYLEK